MITAYGNLLLPEIFPSVDGPASLVSASDFLTLGRFDDFGGMSIWKLAKVGGVLISTTSKDRPDREPYSTDMQELRRS